MDTTFPSGVHLICIPTTIRRGEPLARLKTNNPKKLTFFVTFPLVFPPFFQRGEAKQGGFNIAFIQHTKYYK